MSKIHIHNDNFGHFSLKWCFLGMSENLISQDKYINYDYIYIYIYIYVFSRCFYPKRLTVQLGYKCLFVSMSVPWEFNPQALCC